MELHGIVEGGYVEFMPIDTCEFMPIDTCEFRINKA